MLLREYQNTSVAQLRDGFKAGLRRQLLTSPTGSGKTVIFAYMTSEASRRGLRVLVLAHRSEILDQIEDTLRLFDVQFGRIRAGHGMDITKSVMVASVQTLVRRLDQVPEPDLVIVDEAAHSAANQWVKVFAQYPKAKFVGVTATPERLDGKGLGDYYEKMVMGPSVQWQGRTREGNGQERDHRRRRGPLPPSGSGNASRRVLRQPEPRRARCGAVQSVWYLR